MDEKVVAPPPPLRPLDANDLRLTELNEGYRGLPYVDTTGHSTVGIGHNLTVPMGRVLAELICKYDLTCAREALVDMDPWILWLDPVRQAAVTDLVFNLGDGGYSKFRVFRAAMAESRFEDAVAELENSRWYKQVGRRGPRICRMILTGKWPWDE